MPVPTKKQKTALLKRFEAAKKALAAIRDELRDIESEVQTFGDNADEALDDLERASEALSKYL